MAEAPGLGKIRFDPSISADQQAEISRRLGAPAPEPSGGGNSYSFEYTDRLRRLEDQKNAQQFGNLLSQAGLDATGNPLPGPVPPPPTAAAPTKPQPSTVSKVREGAVTGLQEGASSVLQDLSKASTVLDKAASWINEKTGGPKGGAFASLADTFDSLAKKVAPSEADLKDKNTFTDYLARAIGAAPATVAEYMLGGKVARGAVGGFALIEAIKASDQGAWEAFKGAIKGAVVGKGFEYLNQFSRLIRAGGTAALFGGETALSGGTGAQIGASAVAGGIMGAITPQTKTERAGKPPPGGPGGPGGPPGGGDALIPEVMPKEQGALPPGQERLGLPAPETPAAPKPGEPIQQPDLSQRIAGYLPKDRTPDMIDQALAKTNAEADAFIAQKASGKPATEAIPQRDLTPKGLEDFLPAEKPTPVEELLKEPEVAKALALESPAQTSARAMLEAEAKDTALRQSPEGAKKLKAQLAQQEEISKLTAAKIEAAAAEVGVSGEHVIAAAKVIQEVANGNSDVKKAIDALAKEKTFTSPKESPAVSAEVMARGKAFLGQSGFTRTDLNLFLAKTLAGAIYGGTQGDTTEDKVKNAFMIGGLAAFISPKILQEIMAKLRKVDPKGAKAAEMKDAGASAGAEDSIKINQASEQQIKDFWKLKPEDVQTTGRVDGINFDHINTPQDVKITIGKIAKVFQKDFSEARKKNPDTGEGVSHKETMDFAKSLGMTEQTVLTWPDGKPMNRGEIIGAKIVTVHSARELQTNVENYLANPDSPDALGSFMDRFNKHAMITKNFLAQSSEVARSLEAMKIDVAGDEVVFIKHLGDVVNSIDRTGWEPTRLAKALKDLPDQAQLNQFTRNATKPGKADALLDLWYGASLLSNPKTLVVNSLGTPLALGWQVGKRFIAAGMTDIMGKRGDPNFVQWNEPMSMMWGVRNGFGDAWKAATDAFERGIKTIGRTGKFEVTPEGAFKADTFGVESSTALGMGLDYLGHAARFFPRIMLATDQFLEVVGRSMEVHARVAREAASKTSDPMEMARMMREGVIEDNVPPGIKEAADQFAIYNSFNSEAGSFTAKLQSGIESLKTANPTMGPAYYLMAKAVAPFITIPTNIAKWTVREGPLAVLAENFWQQVNKGGADAQLALAGVSLGSMVMGTAAFLAKEGTISGRGPADANERRLMEADGWQAYSIKVGDAYFKYDRLDPIAMPIGWAADMMDLAGHVSDADYFQAAASAVMVMTRPLANKTYLSGVSSFFDAVFSGEPKKMAKFFAGEASSVVPGLVRGVRQQADPYQREVHTMLDAMLNQVPGQSTKLPPVTDAFGRPIVSGYGAGNDFVKIFGILNPVAYRDSKQNDVIDEIRANRVQVSTPSQTIYGTADSPWDFKPPDARNGVDLTPWEYNYYKKKAGDYFLDKAEKLIGSQSYQTATPGPDGGKAEKLRTLMSVSREYARGQVLREFPGIMDAVKEQMQQRREAVTP